MPSRLPRTALCAAFAVSFAFAACGGDDGETATDATTTTAPADEATTTTAAAEATTTTEVDVEATTTTAPEEVTATTIDPAVENAWHATPEEFRAEGVGAVHEFDCPAGGVEVAIYGTDIYTDDSSACTAGVHVGAITFEDGGTVVVSLAGPQTSYESSERFGVTSQAWDEWPGSFQILTGD
jgi:hypothetical protein